MLLVLSILSIESEFVFPLKWNSVVQPQFLGIKSSFLKSGLTPFCRVKGCVKSLISVMKRRWMLRPSWWRWWRSSCRRRRSTSWRTSGSWASCSPSSGEPFRAENQTSGSYVFAGAGNLRASHLPMNPEEILKTVYMAAGSKKLDSLVTSLKTVYLNGRVDIKCIEIDTSSFLWVMKQSSSIMAARMMTKGRQKTAKTTWWRRSRDHKYKYLELHLSYKKGKIKQGDVALYNSAPCPRYY